MLGSMKIIFSYQRIGAGCDRQEIYQEYITDSLIFTNPFLKGLFSWQEQHSKPKISPVFSSFHRQTCWLGQTLHTTINHHYYHFPASQALSVSFGKILHQCFE